MGKKKGRPKENIDRNRSVRIELSDEEFGALNFVCRKTGKSKSDYVREMIIKDKNRIFNDLLNRR